MRRKSDKKLMCQMIHDLLICYIIQQSVPTHSQSHLGGLLAGDDETAPRLGGECHVHPVPAHQPAAERHRIHPHTRVLARVLGNQQLQLENIIKTTKNIIMSSLE